MNILRFESRWGENIRKRRQVVGLSMKSLAYACGVEIATASRWETGKLIPRDEMKLKIAKALDCKVYDIFVYDEAV